MDSGQPLVIPSNLMERARRLARQQERQIHDVVADALQRGLPLLEETSISADQEQEFEAFKQMYPLWRGKFAGEYVAVYGEQLIDHDPALEKLLERIDTLYPDEFVLIRPIHDEPEIVYDHRSIRWATPAK